MRLKDKVAVVTGGASGIGAASVARFVQEGARVVIGDIQRGPGEAFSKQFGAATVFRCAMSPRKSRSRRWSISR